MSYDQLLSYILKSLPIIQIWVLLKMVSSVMLLPVGALQITNENLLKEMHKDKTDS